MWLVRVIVPNAVESRDRIIKATNSQTAIPPASLRATDRIHRDIEQYMKPFGLFYDRRKNLYKNEGKPIGRIISIPQMAQAVMAIVLQQPDTARARPSSLIKRDDEYLRLFTASYPIEIYKVSVQIIKQVESFLAGHEDKISTADRNNLRFYVAMVVCQNALQNASPSPSELLLFREYLFPERSLNRVISLLKKNYHSLGASDQTAKGSALLVAIKKMLNGNIYCDRDASNCAVKCVRSCQ